MANEAVAPSLSTVQHIAEAIRSNVARVIIGKLDIIDLLLVALLSDGHVLIEDVPGMGKTVLAKALARSLGAEFQRVQGTPDLLPTDIIGVSYFDQKQNEFVFRQGPLFSQLLLVDEVNRTTPRTQSALLEAMAEGQVTVERESKQLPRPFLVIATQNPIELEGTFPLPEAQLDRFLMRLQIGYPSEEEEQAILRRFKNNEPLEELQPVITAEEIVALQRLVRQVQWQPEVEQYLLAIIRSTRTHSAIQLGVSPRGALALYRACEAYAAIQGRDFVQPDDIKLLAPAVLAHRLQTTSRNRMRGKQTVEIIQEIIQGIPVPVETLASPPTKR
ncbi:AAA family ATPase [Tengunoibacter tsumagoiensis]|uniref:ATPase n=1 Tax=Tengunoibacter tsumagoiensis TaxID=2014871 RepID=A0A401ZW61_9CHLR|nr:MoxR family ATPase [Tengunoibacter tsumagoiensis]GCE11139.1 ATPase [Tengunoibacter tsumagoiensis]